MPDAHKNFAASLVATAPSPATSGTSLVVTASDGALFPTVPFNATIWPASTQPTAANAEIVRVTARSTDTLTITRAQEGSSARTVVVGDQVAATVTTKTLTDAEASPILVTVLPAGAIAESIPRWVPPQATAITSQQLNMIGIWLPIGVTITSISFLSTATAGASLVNQLFGLYDDVAGSSSGTARALLRGTNDDGATAWPANTLKTLNLTSTYTTTRSGQFYIGLLINATTVPSFLCQNWGNTTIASQLPYLHAVANSSVTSLPNPAAALSASTGAILYCYVS